MDQAEVLAAIQQILGRMGKRNISEKTDITKDSVLDSIEIIDFIVGVQKKFGVKISERDIFSKELGKVSNLVAYLTSIDAKAASDN